MIERPVTKNVATIKALVDAEGSVTRAAKALGMKRNALYRRLNRDPTLREEVRKILRECEEAELDELREIARHSRRLRVTQNARLMAHSDPEIVCKAMRLFDYPDLSPPQEERNDALDEAEAARVKELILAAVDRRNIEQTPMALDGEDPEDDG